MQEKPIALATEINQEEEAYLKHTLELELSLCAIAGTLNTQNIREALRRFLDTTIANVRAFLAGHPQNTVAIA
jgi:hypothetical protein